MMGQNAAAMIATVVVAIVFYGWGRLVRLLHRLEGGGPGELAFDVTAGWAVVSSLMVAAAVLHLSLASAAWALSAIGLGGIVASWSVYGAPTRAFGLLSLVIALCLPLLILAVATPAMLYDEFEHWLPNAHFVYAFGSLPTKLHPNPASGIPAYPYGGPFINYFASLFAGEWLDAPSKLFTVVLFGLFGLTIAAAVDRGKALRFGTIACGVLLATILDPGFDPRIAMTAYMDSPSGVLCALGALAAWYALSALKSGDASEARYWFYCGGYVGLALVNTRDTNLVLLLGLGLGLVAAGARVLIARPWPALRTASPFVLVPAAGFALWRVFRALSGLPPPLPILPFSQWQWDAFPIVIADTFDQRLAAHVWLGGFALIFLAVIFALAWRAERSLLTIVIVVGLTWYVFLAWAYTATMTPRDVAVAMSFWRYSTELFPPFLLLIIPAARAFLRRRRPSSGRAALAAGSVAALIVIAIPVATPAHWRNDCQFPDILASRRVAAILAPALTGNDWLVVINSEEPAWMALAVGYQLSLDRRRVLPVVLQDGADPVEAVPTQHADEPMLVLDLRPFHRAAMQVSGTMPAIKLYRRIHGTDGKESLEQVQAVAAAPLGGVCRFPDLRPEL